jgi:tRNA(Leu) C34 or U34 (ribose-2'-O)-methylase TrmL
MKVIAKVDKSRVLCEVTTDELALLNGFSSRYDPKFNRDAAMEVGTECNLTRMANTSKFVRNMRKSTLLEAKKLLESMVSGIDDTVDTMTALELFSTLTGEEQLSDD